MVYVKYFVPEDGDDQAHPNVFKVSDCDSVNNLTLGAIKRSFPVDGKYHFRFLQGLQGTKVKVWMDFIDENEVVPHNEDFEVFAKVSRIGVAQHYAPVSQQIPPSQSARSSTSPQAAFRRESFGNPAGESPPMTQQENTTATDSGGGSGSGSTRRNSERLISFDMESPSKSPFHASQETNPSNSNSNDGDGLLDFGGTDDGNSFVADFDSMPASSSGNSSTSDLFSLDASNISKVPLGVNMPPSPSPMHGSNPMGAFGARNPMGGGGGSGGMNRMNMNGLQAPLGGMGQMPHPNQLQQQQNSMNKGKPNSFSGLDSFSFGQQRK